MKKALITGSTAGIGRGIALALANEGYELLLTGRRSEEEIAPLMHLISQKSKGHYLRGDISLEATRRMIFEFVENTWGGLDLLVNNAGGTTVGRKDILDLCEDEIISLLKTNLIAPMLLSTGLAPFMKARKETSYIINISSISSYAVSTNRADYCISKAGMSMLTQQLAARLAAEGIAVFELRPGIIETDMTAGVKDKYDRLFEEGLLPISRWGTPDDVAKAVCGIVKGYFPYSTGEVFNIDGGFHIRRL